MVLDFVDLATPAKCSLPAGPARLGMEVGDDQRSSRGGHSGKFGDCCLRRRHVSQRKGAQNDVRAAVSRRESAAVRQGDPPRQSRLGGGFPQHRRTEVETRDSRPSRGSVRQPAAGAAGCLDESFSAKIREPRCNRAFFESDDRAGIAVPAPRPKIVAGLGRQQNGFTAQRIFHHGVPITGFRTGVCEARRSAARISTQTESRKLQNGNASR